MDDLVREYDCAMAKVKAKRTPTRSKAPTSKPATPKGGAAKASAVAHPKAVAKPAPKAKAIAKPTAKAIAKPTARAIAKPAAKVLAKPAAKAIAKPAAKAPAKPAAKAIAKPTAKAKAKGVTKPKKVTVASVLHDAREIEDPVERAAMIATSFDVVADPDGLVKSWFQASLGVPGRREITAEHAVAMSHATSHVKFLDAVGRELWRRNFKNESIEVLRLAVAAGTTNDTSRMLLGHLLVSQDNAEGVPLLERAIESFPDSALPRETLGRWFVKTDPARALVVLSTPQDGVEHELRAMALTTLNRPDEAVHAQAAALARFDSPVEARWRLAEFHSGAGHKARAFEHAHELFALMQGGAAIGEDRARIEAVIVRAYLEAGQLVELLPWLRAMPSMSDDVAWYVHFGLGALHPNPDPELAIRAANVMADAMRALNDESDARVWQVRAAGVAAKHGNVQPLEELVASGLEDDASAWIEVGNCYMASNDFDAAGAAADRALLLDPTSGGALVMMCRLALEMGDADMLHRVAMALLVAKPAWHEGPEFLSRSFARRLDVEAALMHSARSLEMAVYCHNAWTARAEAMLVSGDLATARTCIERSLEIHSGEPGDEVLIPGAALAGDLEKLEAELAFKYRHLPALPFTEYVACLRRVAAGA